MAYKPKLPPARNETDEPRSPAKTLRIDDVNCSIFKRSARSRDYFSVSFSRSYKDSTGAWRYTKTFDADDLQGIIGLCQQADVYIRGELGSAQQTA